MCVNNWLINFKTTHFDCHMCVRIRINKLLSLQHINQFSPVLQLELHIIQN